MPETRERILTTHAGSLPRPPALAALHLAKARGEPCDEEVLRRTADAAAEEVLARQVEIGLDVVNDGEVGRESFFTYVRHRMSGFSGESRRPPMADLLRYPDYVEQFLRGPGGRESVSLMAAPRATGEVRYGSPAAIEAECERLARLVAAQRGRVEDAFVTAPSPGIVAAAMENAFYPDLASYVRAVGGALRVEYEAVAKAGFLLQIDAPDLALERHTLFQGRPLAEFLEFVRLVVDTLAEALAGIPRERVRLHVCWGNYEAPHDLDVPLAEIWGEVSRVPAGAFLLALANPRHAHEFHALEGGALPPGACVVPGVIDTTTNYVEHPEVVADRIERVAAAVGDPRRVQAGTDCGFETAVGFSSVAPSVAWAKLRSLVEGARIASRHLF
jgi:5-methyltetrahydropteroyltriglutamate--homocysteine methyltransferase